MSTRPWKIASALLVSTALSYAQLTVAANACDTPSVPTGGGGHFGGGGVTVNKPNVGANCGGVTINKPVTVNKNVNIYKPVTIDKSINITKNIDASKNITINKSIVINKGGSASAEASAWASAWASASSSASASANVVIYSGYNEYITINNHIGGGGEIGIGTVQPQGHCEMQEATLVKAVHAVCIMPNGSELPASHMTDKTWIDSGFEGEVMRCIPGAYLKVTIGDVVQSDQGMAGLYASGKTIQCSPFEALRHFKDGMLKCVAKVPVKDCTERTNLRRWGTGDMFFSFRANVCVPSRTAEARQEIELSGMSLTGGVGE